MGESAWDLRERTMEYSVRAVKLYRHLVKSRDGVSQVLGKQFLRAATSVGANVVEARSGESRKDFIHKYSIAQKEARETLYWLELMRRTEVVPAKRLSLLIREVEELIAILTSIILRTKRRATP